LAIESILFVAQGPVDIATLARVAGVTEAAVEKELDSLNSEYQGRGLRIQRSGEAAQYITAPEATPYVEGFLGVDENQVISPAALETLAIIAYKQPIARSTIERIRGVNCDYAVAVLKARSLITEVGRASSPGRPYLYGTTFRFLEHFGLERPEDLPPLPELDRAHEEAGGLDVAEVLALEIGDERSDDMPAASVEDVAASEVEALAEDSRGGDIELPDESKPVDEEELPEDESEDEPEYEDAPESEDETEDVEEPDDVSEDENDEDDEDEPPWQ
jgi:segregation and condensation protein B